jgi:hypothetical protein
VQFRRGAPSRGGAAPIEKVWHRLRVAKLGNSYPSCKPVQSLLTFCAGPSRWPVGRAREIVARKVCS